MSKVYITDYINNPDIEEKILGSEVIADSITDSIEVLLVWHQKIDEEYLSQFPKLRGVVRYGVGYDNIDLGAIRSRGIVFCNTPDYGTDEVSDSALGMILTLTRGIHSYNLTSKKLDLTWQENTINNLKQSSELEIGVIGAGRIGTSLIRKARAVGFKVSFFDPYKPSGYEKAIACNRYHEMQEMLGNADIISIHTPLTNETRGLVDKDFLEKLKDGAYLINTARGEIIQDLDKLHNALQTQKLSGLGLDVLPKEPPESCELITKWRTCDEFIDHRIIINPHTSYYSKESYLEMRVKASQNVKRIIDNKKPMNLIS